MNVGRHLSTIKEHNIPKGSSHYLRLPKSATRYTGTAELEVYLETPTLEEREEEEESNDPGQSPTAQVDVDIVSDKEEDNENSEEDGSQDSDEREDKEYSGESEESEEEEADRITAEKYFTVTVFHNNRYQWLVGFYDYLSRLSAGHKKKYVRLQQAGQMKNMLEYTDSEGDDITCLAKNEEDAVWKHFVVPVLENQTKKGGTVISYLTSFEKFLTYVTNPHCRFLKITRTCSLPSSQRLKAGDRQWTPKLNLTKTRVGLMRARLEEIDALKNSKPYIDGTKAIHQAKQGKVLSQQEFTLARDLLLVRFATDNATRLGPLNTMQRQKYLRATE